VLLISLTSHSLSLSVFPSQTHTLTPTHTLTLLLSLVWSSLRTGVTLDCMQLLALRVAARWSWMVPPLVGDLLAHTVQQQLQQQLQQHQSHSTNQHDKPHHNGSGNRHPADYDNGDDDDDNAARFGFDGASFALAALTPRVDAGALISRLLVPPQARWVR
jgi:hypothetical protein